MIRYNPDAYNSDGKQQNPGAAKREAALVEAVRLSSSETIDTPLTVRYLFYNRDRQAELEAGLASALQRYQDAGQ